ncbi:MAG: serine/threonine-protein kinase [Caldilineaceae bacterium]
MTDFAGHTIDKYTLMERIGSGGMAEVYKACQRPQDREVVVKLLHRHLLAGGEQTARMQREMRIMARLQHPNIVRIFDAGMAGDQPYLVMEYLRGGTLGAYLKARQSIPVEQALDIAAQLADALAYAHRRGVIHRDIKPGNVLFDEAGGKRVLLGDFGLACLDGEAGDRLTVAGAMLGTPVYMSPEAVRGEECDMRSDVYSLGVVLYEMVTGTPPYLANTPYSMLQKLANEPLRRPREVNPALPENVEQLILRAVAKEPEERTATANELLGAIKAAQAALKAPTAVPAERSTARSTPPAAPGTALPPQRNWLSLFGAMMGITAVAMGTAWLLLMH